MSGRWGKTLAWNVLLLALPGCAGLSGSRQAGVPTVQQVPLSARAAESARQSWLRAHPRWSFQGRFAISRGRDGGSGRIDWQQEGSGYRVQMSAPVTRRSWVLSGDILSGAGRLEGVQPGVQSGADVERILRDATGWDIPLALLPDWVRGLAVASGGGQWHADAEGRPRTLQQRGWTIEFLEWTPVSAERPALPRRMEARRGDAKIRLMLDQWDFPS